MNIYKDIKALPIFKNAVITIGSYDGVHKGHQKILHRVVSLANEISGDSVVITFYPHPRKIVDSKESVISVLNTLEEKLMLLQNLGIKNVVIVPFSFEFSRQQPREYIEKFIISNFNPSIIVIGYDHRFGLNRVGNIDLLKEYEATSHFKVIEIPAQEIDENAISSTKIRQALVEGHIEEANIFLNAPYSLSGKVIHGDKLGTKLGFPTANLQISDKDKLIPKQGVYAVNIDIEGVIFSGMMYIGKRPTIQNELSLNIEINIFDFNQNIYDKLIRIDILKYLRSDIKFDSLDDLKKQLYVDEKNAQLAILEINKSIQKKPICTIAILNYNGAELMESYLPMIEYSSSKYEFDVVVIDNGSTDLSVDYIKEWHPEIKVVELSKNYGYAGGYNLGLKNIETEYVVLLNSDVLVTDNWLDPIIDKMEDDKTVGAIQPLILSQEEKNKFEYAGAAGGFIDILGYPFCRGRIFDTLEKNEGQYNESKEVFWASGAALICRTKLFRNLGGFDAAFFAHQEEIDLCWKIKQCGYKVMCISESFVYHLGGGTLDYYNPKKDFYNFRNNLYMLAKNERLGKLLWLIPTRLLLDGVAGLKFLMDGNPKSTIAVIKAHLSFYKHLPIVIEKRNAEQQLIRKNKVGKENYIGRYMGSILWKYYIEGKKVFSALQINH